MEAETASDSGSDELSSEERDLELALDLLELREDREKCRRLRRQYRQLMYAVQRDRERIVRTASDTLSEALEEANELFDGVRRTREAALDAQFLVLASDLGQEKAQQLHADMIAFNPAAFCGALCALGNGLPDARAFWAALQREAAGGLRRAETFHFVLGSFKAEPPARRRRPEPAPRPLPEGPGAMPTKLRRLDAQAQPETTEAQVERVLGLLQTYFRRFPDAPVSYFEFVVDPHSFSRTVENMFHVSFIIRDGFARLRLDPDRLPILEPTGGGAGEEGDVAGRKQVVLALSLQDWKNLVSTFEISEAMIGAPHGGEGLAPH